MQPTTFSMPGTSGSEVLETRTEREEDQSLCSRVCSCFTYALKYILYIFVRFIDIITCGFFNLSSNEDPSKVLEEKNERLAQLNNLYLKTKKIKNLRECRPTLSAHTNVALQEIFLESQSQIGELIVVSEEYVRRSNEADPETVIVHEFVDIKFLNRFLTITRSFIEETMVNPEEIRGGETRVDALIEIYTKAINETGLIEVEALEGGLVQLKEEDERIKHLMTAEQEAYKQLVKKADKLHQKIVDAGKEALEKIGEILTTLESKRVGGQKSEAEASYTDLQSNMKEQLDFFESDCKNVSDLI